MQLQTTGQLFKIVLKPIGNSFKNNGSTSKPKLYTGLFHSKHGVNVELSNTRITATCKPDAKKQRFLFSSKSIDPNEVMVLRIIKAYRDLTFGFGFTTLNPAKLLDVETFDEVKKFEKFFVKEISMPFIKIEVSFSYDLSGRFVITVHGDTSVIQSNVLRSNKGYTWYAVMYLRGNGSSVALVRQKSGPELDQLLMKHVESSKPSKIVSMPPEKTESNVQNELRDVYSVELGNVAEEHKSVPQSVPNEPDGVQVDEMSKNPKEEPNSLFWCCCVM